MEVARAEPFGNRLGRTEVHHIRRADRHDLRYAPTCRRSQPIRSGRQYAAD